MSNFSKDLDNYITGHYGANEFKTYNKTDRNFRLGVLARRKGKPITACKCKTAKERVNWRFGWSAEDRMIRHSESELLPKED